ncbi:MAG: hypothetical protein V3T05_00170 [Myxococcota bacterium]
MDETNLVSMCATAFAAVFLLLLILAAFIRILTLVFPAPKTGADDAVAKAIAEAVVANYPGMRVTRIEEES